MGPTTPPTKKLHRVWPWPRGDCVRSSVDVDDGATSSTGLGLRRTRPPGPPVGGQERFFGGERHPTLTAPRASLPVMARRFRPDLREIGLFEGLGPDSWKLPPAHVEGLDASSWPRRRDLRPPGGLGLGRTRPPPAGPRSTPDTSTQGDSVVPRDLPRVELHHVRPSRDPPTCIEGGHGRASWPVQGLGARPTW